jgi:hypothetical protein
LARTAIQAHGQHIGRAQRDHAEPGAGPHQSVGDLGDRAIAAGRYHHLLPVEHSVSRQCLGMAGAVGFSEIQPHAIGGQHVQYPPQQMRPPASGDWIEHDDHRWPMA